MYRAGICLHSNSILDYEGGSVMKEWMKSFAIGLGIACMFFCAVCVFFDLRNGGTFILEDHMFTKMMVATIAIGLGWGAPAMLYHNDKKPLPGQMILHLLCGMTVMTIASYLVGWIPVSLGIGACIAVLAGQYACALLIFAGMYHHNKKLAQKMNARMQELNRELH